MRLHQLTLNSLYKVVVFIMLLWISACLSSPQAHKVSEFPGIQLMFETKKWDDTLLTSVRWSRGAKLSIGGIRIPIPSSQAYIANANKPGALVPLFIDTQSIPSGSLSPKGNYYFYIEENTVHIASLDEPIDMMMSFSIENGQGATWYPDESQISLVQFTKGKKILIDFVDLDGNFQRFIEITDPIFTDYKFLIDLEWSHDGNQIAFILQKGETEQYQQSVFVFSVDSNKVTQISPSSDRSDKNISWSPDSQRLVFISTPLDSIPETSGRLIFVNADGSCPKISSSLIGMSSVSWSPDSNSLAIVSEGKVYLLHINLLSSEYLNSPLVCP